MAGKTLNPPCAALPYLFCPTPFIRPAGYISHDCSLLPPSLISVSSYISQLLSCSQLTVCKAIPRKSAKGWDFTCIKGHPHGISSRPRRVRISSAKRSSTKLKHQGHLTAITLHQHPSREILSIGRRGHVFSEPRKPLTHALHRWLLETWKILSRINPLPTVIHPQA